MKRIFIVFLVTTLIVVAMASPAKDLKEAKKEAARKKGCMRNCDSEKLEPVCAGKQGAKSLSFGSLCVMNNYNCEKNEALSKISNGECLGGDGIRLS